MRLVLRGAVLFVFLLSLGIYTAFKEQGSIKASREIASLSEGVHLLSLKELNLLSSKNLQAYTHELSRAMAKASFLKGAFNKTLSVKTSFQFKFIEEAYALVRCPIQGLHPAQKNTDEECNKQIRGIVISEEAVSNSTFDTSSVRDGALRCSEGKNMCSPAMVGFDFSEEKPQLRCLEDASNENCSKLSTSGEDMKKSLGLLAEVAPNFWKEFESGINEACFDGDVFKESDEGCRYVKRQMNQSTLKFRNKLTQEYRDLAAKLEESSSRVERSSKVCKPFQKDPSDELGLADHRNFDEPGQKVVVFKGHCWRLPADTVVVRTGNKYRFMQPGEDVLNLPIGGVGEDTDRVGSARFYNFRCGPCNKAKQIATCIFQQRRPQADRLNVPSLEQPEQLNMDDCRAYVSDLETRELPAVIFDKVEATGQEFYQMEAID